LQPLDRCSQFVAGETLADAICRRRTVRTDDLPQHVAEQLLCAPRRDRHVDAAATETSGGDPDEQRPERPVDASLRLLTLPHRARDLAQPQRHLVVPHTRWWLLPARGSEPQRGRGGERGGERQRGGKSDPAALAEDETKCGRRDTTGGDEE